MLSNRASRLSKLELNAEAERPDDEADPHEEPVEIELIARVELRRRKGVWTGPDTFFVPAWNRLQTPYFPYSFITGVIKSEQRISVNSAPGSCPTKRIRYPFPSSGNPATANFSSRAFLPSFR
jgi:hypothetical protein